jgi:hypothetical protein
MTEPSDRYEGLPETWSQTARETYVQVAEAHPGLGPHALATLYNACALEALADCCDAQVLADGPMVTGSRGQMVAHPLLAESRQARAAAVAALRALGLAAGQGRASAAGAALAGKRWDGRSQRSAAMSLPIR